MGVLQRLWVAMLTQNTDDAGTNDPIVLIINEDGVDKLHHTFLDTSQDDQDQGQANLYEINVEGRNIRSENLTNSSIRMAIRGSNLWRPQHILVWGQESIGGAVIPLALEFNIEEGISTDWRAGNLSFPLQRIGVLDTNARIRQLLLLLTTANVSGAGTESTIQLELTFPQGHEVTLSPPGDTPQNDLEQGQANFYILPPQGVFGIPGGARRSILESVVLRILGEDLWLPSSLFLFGLPFRSDTPGVPRPEFIMPLVHIPNWDLGGLSRDRTEGRESVVLPLATIPLLLQDFVVEATVAVQVRPPGTPR